MLEVRVLERELADPVFYADKSISLRKTDYRLRELTKDVDLSEMHELCEVCCGTGDLAYLIALRYPLIQVLGADISLEAIEYAQTTHDPLPNLRYIVRDCCALGENDGKFDLVLSIKSLHHFDNPKEVIQEMLRVAKKRGKIYINDFTREIIPSYLRCLELWEQRGVYTDNTLLSRSIKASLSEDEFRRLISELGLLKSDLRFFSYNYHTLDSVHALFSGIEIPEVKLLITKT